MYRNLLLAVEENIGFRKDPRFYIIHKHIQRYPSKSLSLGNSDLLLLQEVGWRVIGLSVLDDDIRDETKLAYLQYISILAIDVIEDITRILRETKVVLYRNLLRVRLGGRLISRSVMGRDFDSDIHGDIYMRFLYRNNSYSRLVMSLNPFSKDKYILIYQDGIPIFHPGCTAIMDGMHIQHIGKDLYITGIYNGNRRVISAVMDDGRVQVDIRKSKE